jgi:hypothetical protein
MAYILARTTYVPWGPEQVKLSQKTWLYYGPVTDPNQTRSVTLGEWGMAKTGYSLLDHTHLVFSLQGARLAVVSPGAILFVDLASGKVGRSRLPDETITSLGWIAPQTIGYASFKNAQPEGVPLRTIWRQDVESGPEKRTSLLQDKGVGGAGGVALSSDDWPREYWSPDGRYVLFREAGATESASLLEVSTQRTRPLGPEGTTLERGAWKHDGSAVLWASLDRKEGKYRILLLTLAKGQPWEITTQCQGVLGNNDPQFESLWTGDDQFIVGSTLDLGGYLLRPEPFEFRSLGSRLKRSNQPYAPSFRVQFAPGLLIANRPNLGEAVVDYDGKIIKELDFGGLSGWSIAPDGKNAFSVWPGDKIHEVSLP